jgi:hypothetical protein
VSRLCLDSILGYGCHGHHMGTTAPPTKTAAVSDP